MTTIRREGRKIPDDLRRLEIRKNPIEWTIANASNSVTSYLRATKRSEAISPFLRLPQSLRSFAMTLYLLGSSDSCVGAIQFPPLCKGRGTKAHSPPLCKGRHGGVEASRGCAERESRGSCKPVRFLPPHPLLTIEGDSLGNHRRPSKNPYVFLKSHLLIRLY